MCFLRYFILVNMLLILTACSSFQQSYLPTGEKPIVNIEAELAPILSVVAKTESLEVSNLTENSLNLYYKLFWYDLDGVTQGANMKHDISWVSLSIKPKSTENIKLIKPTLESKKYRFYIRK